MNFPKLNTRLPRGASALTLALVAAALAGCASKTPLNVAPVAAAPAAEVAAAPAAASAQTQPAAQSDVAAVDLTRDGAAAQEPGRFVYFDFDSFAVRSDFTPVIEAQSRRLAADASKRLVIAGHADERGSREYNLALGQKRADAVARSLVLLGSDARRLETVSFGEERPKARGSNEEAWSLNRRAELSAR